MSAGFLPTLMVTGAVAASAIFGAHVIKKLYPEIRAGGIFAASLFMWFISFLLTVFAYTEVFVTNGGHAIGNGFWYGVAAAIYVWYSLKNSAAQNSYVIARRKIKVNQEPKVVVAPMDDLEDDLGPIQLKPPVSPLDSSSLHSKVDEPADGPGEHDWAEAMRDVESEGRSEGLWAEAFAKCDGDQARAIAFYVRRRAEQIWQANRNRDRSSNKAYFESREQSLKSPVCPKCGSGVNVEGAHQCIVCGAAIY